MVQLSLLTAGLLASAAVAAPGPQPNPDSDLEARQGYYFQNWSEGSSNIRCNNGGGGGFTANWSSKGGFVCGKGWSYGGARYLPNPPLLPIVHTEPHHPSPFSVLTPFQGHQIHRHLQRHRARLPGRLRLDAQPADRVLHHRVTRRPGAQRAVDVQGQLHV